MYIWLYILTGDIYVCRHIYMYICMSIYVGMSTLLFGPYLYLYIYMYVIIYTHSLYKCMVMYSLPRAPVQGSGTGAPGFCPGQSACR